MARAKAPINPFYAILTVVGVAFTITACAYGVLLLRATRGLTAEGSEAPGLMRLLDLHGLSILAAELGLLGLCTIGAIWLDHVRGQREMAARRRTQRAGGD
jgi:hypothetical protein